MDVNNPIQFDPRPNRRKDKDNPYTILTVGIETDTPHYFVSFTDNSGKPCCLEISKELYELFDRFELDDLAFLNEVERHYSDVEITERTTIVSPSQKNSNVENDASEQIINRELRQAIKALPDKQRRRLCLYYFGGYTYAEIAELENCSIHSVYMAVERAKEKIKIFLKNFSK
ncbi:MAG: sigma-70 family RNA polymerase sigma factor [Lachnospiraceae bacterium]|nr:sigma-70 family RNA polymerase sigma factor [Lachnospiraceae bacterium]